MSEARSFDCFGTIRTMLCAYLVCKGLSSQIPAKVDFARDIQPLFRDHCIECHGPSQQMRGLRLDRRRDAMPNRVGANGARIVPGDSARSSLYRRVSATQSGAQMPPSGPLRPEQINFIKAWIDQGADWPDELSGDRDTAPADPAVVSLRNALRNGDRQEFNRVLRDNPESVNAKGPSGWTPIMYAALYGDGEAVRLLLDKGANPNARNNRGGTALMYAIDNEEKTRLLLDHGADPNLRSGEGRTALLDRRGTGGSLSRSETPAGERRRRRRPASGWTRRPDPADVAPATQSCCSCFWTMAPIRSGFPSAPYWWRAARRASTCCSHSRNPPTFQAGFQGAVRIGDLPRMKTLLDRGARPPAISCKWSPPLPRRFPSITIRSLIAAGADVNAKTSTGLTLLDFANRHGNATLAEALTAAGVPGETRVPSQPLRKPPHPFEPHSREVSRRCSGLT